MEKNLLSIPLFHNLLQLLFCKSTPPFPLCFSLSNKNRSTLEMAVLVKGEFFLVPLSFEYRLCLYSFPAASPSEYRGLISPGNCPHGLGSSGRGLQPLPISSDGDGMLAQIHHPLMHLWLQFHCLSHTPVASSIYPPASRKWVPRTEECYELNRCVPVLSPNLGV